MTGCTINSESLYKQLNIMSEFEVYEKGCNRETDIGICLTIKSDFESNRLNNRGPMVTCKNWLNLQLVSIINLPSKIWE